MGICNSGGMSDGKDLSALNYEQELKYFYVVTVVFNPARSRHRIKLYLNFRKQMEKLGMRLITLECAYENAPFTVTSPNYEPYNIQLRTNSPLFFKEHLLNKAFFSLPSDARYVCLVDFETEFLNPNWMNETIKALHMFKAAQLFEEIVYLGPNGEEQKRFKGFAYELATKKDLEKDTFELIAQVAGYGWAYQVEALRELGGLFDQSVIGNSEKVMAYCLAARTDEYLPSDLTKGFKESVKNWQKKAALVFNSGIGYVPGTINIHYSGSKRDKKSYENWEILKNNAFNPKQDLSKDEKGLYAINKSNTKLLEDMTAFFNEINGEMIDL